MKPCQQAYRLASIGLVGNRATIIYFFFWCFAYRLASIGLVGNIDISEIVTSECGSLPIGFDRIGWKLKLHWLSWQVVNDAYRLASIGLVGNMIASTVPTWGAAIGLPIGFDRIGWKHVLIWRCNCDRASAYRLASIGLVGNNDPNDRQSNSHDRLPIGFDRIGWKLSAIQFGAE